jgi:hypothetical protein
MRRALSTLLFAATLLMASVSLAQNPNYDVGPVWRVTYYSIKPGEADAFWKDFREHIKPLYDEYKKAGLIVEYKAFVNPVIDHPHDWDVAIGLLYPNYAALDQLDAKGASVVVKHYGSREAAFEAAKKRAELREVVASHLAREVIVK